MPPPPLEIREGTVILFFLAIAAAFLFSSILFNAVQEIGLLRLSLLAFYDEESCLCEYAANRLRLFRSQRIELLIRIMDRLPLLVLDLPVELGCRQINSGIRLDISSDFLTEYPDGVLFIKAGGGRLMYSYTEKRIAYFEPGSVSLVLSDGGQETVLLTRTLVSQEILTLKVSVAAGAGAVSKGISISLDTSRVWTNETYVLGGEDSKGVSYEDSLTVSQALASVGREDVWVSGFIVGGDLTSANASFAPPFKSSSNLILGPRSSSSSRENCIAVQLPSGDIRDMLNLADHPEMLGRLVCLNGDIESSYYGMVGLKSVSDFVLK